MRRRDRFFPRGCSAVVVQDRRDDARRALVGAVTTRPPDAFSSLTASATRFTQSSANAGSRCGSSAARRTCQSWRACGREDCRAGTRPWTCPCPGRRPSHRGCATAAPDLRLGEPAWIAHSWRIIASLTESPSRSVRASSSAAEWKAPPSAGCPVPGRSIPFVTTKPPPTEKYVSRAVLAEHRRGGELHRVRVIVELTRRVQHHLGLGEREVDSASSRILPSSRTAASRRSITSVSMVSGR